MTIITTKFQTRETVEQLIFFIDKYNIQIIQGIVLIISLLVIVWAYYQFIKTSSFQGSEVNNDIREIEVLLKEILSKNTPLKDLSNKISSVELNEVDSQLQTEIVELRKELELKQKQIQEVANSQPAIDPVEKNELEQKIKELESKLIEYEIIAEDIADLTRYKEENQKLKKQIEAELALRESQMSIKAEQSSTQNEQAIDPKKLKTEDVTLDKNQELQSTFPQDSTIDDDLMAEFTKAVEAQKSKETKNITDLPGNDMNSLVDIEQVLNEASGLKESLEAPVGNSLDQEINPDKLVEEASALENLAPEDRVVMENFESFTKGNG